MPADHNLIVFPTIAGAEPLTACDFIRKAEVERLLLGTVSTPMVMDMNLCAGMCPSVNASRCEFSTADGGQANTLYLDVEVPPYEFSAKSERRITEIEGRGPNGTLAKNVMMQDVPGFGKNAFWYYDTHTRQSLLFAYPSSRVRFLVQEINVEPQAALANATVVVTKALEKYRSLPSSRVKSAFEFKTIGGTYEWRPSN